MEYISYIIIVAIVAAVLYFFYQKGKKVTSHQNWSTIDLSSAKMETVDGELKMTEVMDIFKSQVLNPQVHTPFIAASLTGFCVIPQGILEKDGYKSLIIGTYAEDKEQMQFMEIVFAKSFDKQLQRTLAAATSDNPIVVLS